MVPRIEIKLDEVDFHQLALDLLEKCPFHASKSFSEGFHYFICEFFNDLDTMLIYLQIEKGVASLPLETFLTFPLDNLSQEMSSLNFIEAKEFMLGVDRAIELSTEAIYLVSYSPFNNQAA